MIVKRRIGCRNGFTFLEVMVALAVFAVGLLAVSLMAVTSLKSTHFSQNMVTAVNLAQSHLDELRVDRSNTPLEMQLDSTGQPGNGIFNRTVNLVSCTDPNYTVVQVTVSWSDGILHQITLETIFAD